MLWCSYLPSWHSDLLQFSHEEIMKCYSAAAVQWLTSFNHSWGIFWCHSSVLNIRLHQFIFSWHTVCSSLLFATLATPLFEIYSHISFFSLAFSCFHCCSLFHPVETYLYLEEIGFRNNGNRGLFFTPIELQQEHQQSKVVVKKNWFVCHLRFLEV